MFCERKADGNSACIDSCCHIGLLLGDVEKGQNAFRKVFGQSEVFGSEV